MELVNTAKRFDELRDLNAIVYIEDHFDSKGRRINIHFRKENFPHLVGLHKLTDVYNETTRIKSFKNVLNRLRQGDHKTTNKLKSSPTTMR